MCHGGFHVCLIIPCAPQLRRMLEAPLEMLEAGAVTQNALYTASSDAQDWAHKLDMWALDNSLAYWRTRTKQLGMSLARTPFVIGVATRDILRLIVRCHDARPEWLICRV